MRALVISGGASKGAYAGGVAEFLLKDCGQQYDVFVGTSAGSLLLPLLALGAVDRLRDVFTSVTQKDIFSICPFKIRKKYGVFYSSINHFNTLRMFLRRKKTFGESKNLRKLIASTFTKMDYDKLRDSDKEVVVTVSNLTCHRIEYKSIHECSYEDFCDWMWISANIVPFMSLVRKNGMEYADGGFGNYLPLQEAIKRGACVIDAIILKTQEGKEASCFLPSRNAFHTLIRAFDFMLEQISNNDMIIGQLEGLHQKVSINCYYTPRILTENSFIFDPERMSKWWMEGQEYARVNSPTCFKSTF